jgi:hypothetical protein
MIRDQDSLKAWLETRSRDDAVLLATRAALRVMPLWGQEMSREWARSAQMTGLPLLRILFCTLAVRGVPQLEAKQIVWSAQIDAEQMYENLPEIVLSSLGYAVLSSARASDVSVGNGSIAVSVATSIDHARLAAPVVHDARLVSESEEDVSAISSGTSEWPRPLWHTTPPDWFTDAWAETQRIWDADPAPWDFWHRWYQGILDGTPMPDALLRDIALIPDDIWQAGPQAVAERIAMIEERHRLLAEVADLKERVALALAPMLSDMRGHNNPPELIDVPPNVRNDFTIVWANLDDVQPALASPDPQPSHLARAGQSLVAAGKRILSYCAGLADTALQKAAQVGGAAFGAYMALNLPGWLRQVSEKIVEVGAWLLRFAEKL